MSNLIKLLKSIREKELNSKNPNLELLANIDLELSELTKE